MREYYITKDEMEQAKTMLEEKGVGWIKGKFHKPTNKQDANLLHELDAMRMIHSFIAYRPLNKKDEWVKDRYFEDYLKKLGVKKLQTLIDKAVEKVEYIGYAGTDSRGGNYNSIQWKA